MKKSSMKLAIGGVVVLAVLVGAFFFLHKGGGEKMTMKETPPPAATAEQSAQLQAGQADHAPTTLTFNISSGNFYFVPNFIRVKKGDTVKIILSDDGGTHNLVIDEFKFKTAFIKTGETTTAEFVADKTGTFEFYCDMANHRTRGQKGILIVE